MGDLSKQKRKTQARKARQQEAYAWFKEHYPGQGRGLAKIPFEALLPHAKQFIVERFVTKRIP